MRTYTLGKKGRAFLEHLLENGDQLAYALGKEDLSKGQLLTFLPDTADLRKISLKEGGLGRFEWDEEACQSVRRLVRAYLKIPDAVCVMELKSTSRKLAAQLYNSEPYEVFFSGSRHVLWDANGVPMRDVIGVYGYVSHVDGSNENVEELIDDRRPFGAVGALTYFGSKDAPSSKMDSDISVFTELARNAQYVLGSAFDDEGWIIWARHLPSEIRVEGLWDG